MSSTRWDAGEFVAESNVFSDHERERQRDVGTAPPESRLRHQHFPEHRHWNVDQLLRQTHKHKQEQRETTTPLI